MVTYHKIQFTNLDGFFLACGVGGWGVGMYATKKDFPIPNGELEIPKTNCINSNCDDLKIALYNLITKQKYKKKTLKAWQYAPVVVLSHLLAPVQ